MTRVREAAPRDAGRLARLRYDFRAAEDPAAEGREAFLERGVHSLILWPTEDSRSLYRRFGCTPSEGLFELDVGAD